MKKLVLVLAIVIAMVLGGWVVFRQGEGFAGIEFRTDKAKQDVEKMVRQTQQAVENAKNEIEKNRSSSDLEKDN